jgi:uncharacterized Zn-binding protein involved in type VI secretion
MPTRISIAAAILAGAALLTLVASADDGVHVAKPTSAEPAAAKASAGGGAPTLGKPENVKWTATTYEAAATEANKKVLESGKPAAVTGEVVDVSCYLQLGKRGEAHIPCGTKCLQNGQPIGLVDAEDNLYIVMAEEHHPRRDGEVELKSVFIPLLAKTVTVNGMAVEMKGYRALFVQAAELRGVVKKAEAPKK